LAVALRTPNTVARILPNTKGRDAELYGLVSGGRFQPTDKRAVRHEYHRTLARFGIAADRPRYGHRAGAPTETYPLPDLSGRTRSSVELKYGLDNGASGYRLSLSDIEVVVCSNGLTYDVLREGAIRWRHVRGEPVETFLTDGLEALLTWRGRLEDSMTLAEEREADGTARQWADRALPQGADPTERHRILRAVTDRHQVETARHGDTAWAVSQALSWVGTHELRGLDGWRLRRAATEVLLSA
jgi:hypothetical protein